MSWMASSFQDRYVSMQNQPSKKPYVNPLLRAIATRKKANMDTRIIIEGQAGIGKSWFALKLAEKLDKTYLTEPHKAVKDKVFFTAADYLNAVTSQPPNAVLIYDEAGQTWHHREFMSEANLILSKTMIGYRFKRFITILCIPTIEMIDKDARALSQFLVNVVAHGKCEVYKTVTAKFGGALWYKTVMDVLTSGTPNVKLRNAYEIKKRETQDEFYKMWGNQLNDSAAPKITNSDIVNTVKENPHQYMKNERLNVPLLTGHFNIGRDRAEGIRAKYESENPKG